MWLSGRVAVQGPEHDNKKKNNKSCTKEDSLKDWGFSLAVRVLALQA